MPVDITIGLNQFHRVYNDGDGSVIGELVRSPRYVVYLDTYDQKRMVGTLRRIEEVFHLDGIPSESDREIITLDILWCLFNRDYFGSLFGLNILKEQVTKFNYLPEMIYEIEDMTWHEFYETEYGIVEDINNILYSHGLPMLDSDLIFEDLLEEIEPSGVGGVTYDIVNKYIFTIDCLNLGDISMYTEEDENGFMILRNISGLRYDHGYLTFSMGGY